MKTACLGTSAVLTVKNYLQNIGGKGIARHSIMNNEGGWYERCDYWVDKKIPREGGNGQPYKTQEQCLIKEADNIDKDVNEYYDFMNKEQKYLENLQTKYPASGKEIFAQQQVDTSALAGDLSQDVNNNIDFFGTTFLDPEGPGDVIDLTEIKKVLSQEGYEQNKYEIEQLRDIDVYTKILKSSSSSDRLKEMANKNLYSTFY